MRSHRCQGCAGLEDLIGIVVRMRCAPCVTSLPRPTCCEDDGRQQGLEDEVLIERDEPRGQPVLRVDELGQGGKDEHRRLMPHAGMLKVTRKVCWCCHVPNMERPCIMLWASSISTVAHRSRRSVLVMRPRRSCARWTPLAYRIVGDYGTPGDGS